MESITYSLFVVNICNAIAAIMMHKLLHFVSRIWHIAV